MHGYPVLRKNTRIRESMPLTTIQTQKRFLSTMKETINTNIDSIQRLCYTHTGV